MPDLESGTVPYKEDRDSESREEALQRVRTAGNLSISPELFEKLYLTPKTPTKGNLRQIIGNPSAL